MYSNFIYIYIYLHISCIYVFCYLTIKWHETLNIILCCHISLSVSVKWGNEIRSYHWSMFLYVNYRAWIYWRDCLYCKQKQPPICHTDACLLFAEWSWVESLDLYVVWEAGDRFPAGAAPPQIVGWCAGCWRKQLPLIPTQVLTVHIMFPSWSLNGCSLLNSLFWPSMAPCYK